jgi:hypothetical protein
MHPAAAAGHHDAVQQSCCLASSPTSTLDRPGRARCDDSLCAVCQPHRCAASALDHVYAKCCISYSGAPV